MKENRNTNDLTKFCQKLLKRIPKKIVALGLTSEDFGTHSIRKGEATFVSTGCTVSPPMASICIRANWTLGGKSSISTHEKKINFR